MTRNLKEFLVRSMYRATLEALRFSSAKFRYQPKSWTDTENQNAFSDRASVDRLNLIRPLLCVTDRNILDLGSNAGFFSIELGQTGYRCHGIELDHDLVVYSTLAAYLRRSPHVSFEQAYIDEKVLEDIQPYDAILNFSIMHHIILHHGLEYATRILHLLRAKTKRVMFIEMGQSDESAADWAGRLPVMAPDPEAWISNWLRESGFANVSVVGRSEKRLIFAAYSHGA